MGYFPNGTAGMDYEERYCVRCVHYKDADGEPGCPVWMVHLLYNYDQHDNETTKSILNLLIPRGEDKLDNERCNLFIEDTTRPDPNQLDMFE